MPAPKPAAPADWDTSNTNLLAPSGGQIASGFASNQVLPSNWLNWFWNLVGQWTDYLRDFEIQAHTWTVAQQFNAGIAVTLTGAGAALSASNFGAGSGITGSASNSAATGVAGTNSAGGPGVTGASTSGVGGQLTGNATRAPLLLTPQSAPSTPVSGEIWHDGASLNFDSASGNQKVVTDLTPVLTALAGSYQNTYADLGGSGQAGQFFKIGNRAFLRAQITSGLTPGAGICAVGFLPAAYRPSHAAIFPIWDDTARAANAVQINIDGSIQIQLTPAASHAILINGSWECGF